MRASIKNILFVLICVSVQVSAQTNDPIVMKLGQEETRLSDFKNTFLKNNDLKKTTEKDLREYIELYAIFRLKCIEAEAMNLDTIASLEEELVGYRKQVSEKYLTDKEVSDKILEEALSRMQWDIRASHILKRVMLDAPPADTLEAYQAIMKIRNRILKGESFAAVAAAESDDPSARDKKSAGGDIMRKGNGGDLGYFTVFDLIYSFENGAYTTAIGEVSMPIRSEFGYHLIQVQDKKPALGKIKATQILLSYNKSPNLNANERYQDTANVIKRINEIYNAVKGGMSFDDAETQYLVENEKPSTLPPFGSNRFEGEFIKGLYGLKKGEISKPIKTSFGYHVVLIDEIEPVVIDNELRTAVKNKILRDNRSNKSKEAFVERVKKENNFKDLADKKAKTTPVEDFYSVVDSLIFSGKWTASQAKALNKNMFSFAEKNYNQQDFATYLEQTQHQFQGTQDVDVKVLVNFAYRQFIENTVVDYEDSRLEEKHPDFAQLMKEYKEGILIYELSEIKIWRKAVIDTVGLEAFYETVKNNHFYPVRVRAEYYKAVDEATTKKLAPMLKKETPADKILEKMNKKSITLVFDTVIYWQGQNKHFDNIVDWNKISDTKMFVNTTENELVRIMEVLQPSVKPLSEARGVVVSEYQTYLEKKWLEDIRKNNVIWIDYETILSLIKK